MKKDGNSGGKRSADDLNKKIKDRVKDPVSNPPSGNKQILKQENNQELNKRKSDENLRRSAISGDAATSYETSSMGAEADDERQGSIIPDDPIEAEQVESEKLRFGFSFEPKEGQLGDETEDEGDLTADQRRTGNRYRPSMGVDDGERDEEDIASDQELRVTDQGHIGMAFGEDNYVEKGEDEEEI